MNGWKTAALVLALAWPTLMMPQVVRGDVMLVSDPATLAADDSVDWGQLGADGTELPPAVSVVSVGGWSAAVATADPAGLLRLDQGNSWNGLFAPGDRLLNNNSIEYDPLTITFGAAVMGVGTYIDLDAGLPYTGFIEAFAGTRSLGQFTVYSPGDTPLFLGVLSTTPEISRVVLGIDDPPSFNGDFALNGLQIRTFAVPEPSSVVLSGVGVLVLSLLALGKSGLSRRVAGAKSSCPGLLGRDVTASLKELSFRESRDGLGMRP